MTPLYHPPTSTSCQLYDLDLWFCSFPVKTSSEPGIGLGGLGPSSPPSHHHIRSLSSFELGLFCFPGMRFSNPVSMGGLDPPPFQPTSAIPVLPFSGIVLFFSVSRTFRAWLGTSLAKHQTLLPLFRRRRRKCEHSIPVIGLGGRILPLFRPTIHHHPFSPSPTTRITRTSHAGQQLERAPPPLPLAPCTITFHRQQLRRLSPLTTLQGRH